MLGNSAGFLKSLGRLDEALALEEAIVRRDPVNMWALYDLGRDQRSAGRLDAAIALYRTVLSLSPGWAGAHYALGVALLLKGEAQGALAEIEQETGESSKRIGLPMAYHALGRKADSDAALAALIAKYEKDRPTTSLTSTPSGARLIRRLRGSTRRSSTATPASPDRDGKPVRQDPRRSALAAVPAQGRLCAGATGEDRVQGDAAAMSMRMLLQT